MVLNDPHPDPAAAPLPGPGEPPPPPASTRALAGDWDEVGARLRRLARRAAKTMNTPGVRCAAVLVPLVEGDPFGSGRGGLHVVLTRRPATLRAHAGQVSFPGGTLHEGEGSLDAALREAEEELGIPRDRPQVLGPLHDVDTTTGFAFTPWVARLPGDLAFVPAPAEVARVFATPLSHLADPAQLRHHEVDHRGLRLKVPAWTWDGEVVWGATARVLKDLVELLGAP